jgi:hypothetical protein
MHTCPLRRAFSDTESRPCPARRTSRPPATPGTQSTPQTQSSDSARYWLHIVMTLSSLLGWRALTRLLDAIPDSNDDFGLF